MRRSVLSIRIRRSRRSRRRRRSATGSSATIFIITARSSCLIRSTSCPGFGRIVRLRPRSRIRIRSTAIPIRTGSFSDLGVHLEHQQVAFSRTLLDSGTTWPRIRHVRRILEGAQRAAGIWAAVKPAVMTVGGLFDAEDCYGALHVYQAIEKTNPNAFNVLVVGPWFHGGWSRSAGDELGNIGFASKHVRVLSRQHRGGLLPALSEG